MNSALWLPLFDELADPLAVVRVAAEAEEASRPTSSTLTSSPRSPPRIAELRHEATMPSDLVVGLPIGVDPGPHAKACATWWLPEFVPEAVSLDQVQGVLRNGPLTP